MTPEQQLRFLNKLIQDFFTVDAHLKGEDVDQKYLDRATKGIIEAARILKESNDEAEQQVESRSEDV